MVAQSGNTTVFEHRFLPSWTVLVAIFLFPFGLVALLARGRERAGDPFGRAHFRSCVQSDLAGGPNLSRCPHVWMGVHVAADKRRAPIEKERDEFNGQQQRPMKLAGRKRASFEKFAAAHSAGTASTRPMTLRRRCCNAMR